MNVLDSRLEALAFNYVSFGIFTVVNNLWTWVALLTAAVSFWRIKTAGLKSEQPRVLSSAICIDTHNNNDEARPETSQPESPPSPTLSFSDTASSSSLSSRLSIFENDGVSKGKFVMYYAGDRESDGNCDGDGCTVVGVWGCGGSEEWPERIVLRTRMSEMGWYRNQDLTVFNGNVVRLWDEVRNGNCSSGCAVW
ncbi:uncharacterized protein LOC8288758 [Ricinus communis]|uniref:uncharacterized protein LOC8288758 n=1 Tax=Ricinus communis TaxID=3988 RepID=UPI00201B04AD|nr:uncharacterized protein LOC8288758 [Ricinus communis]